MSQKSVEKTSGDGSMNEDLNIVSQGLTNQTQYRYPRWAATQKSDSAEGAKGPEGGRWARPEEAVDASEETG